MQSYIPVSSTKTGKRNWETTDHKGNTGNPLRPEIQKNNTGGCFSLWRDEGLSHDHQTLTVKRYSLMQVHQHQESAVLRVLHSLQTLRALISSLFHWSEVTAIHRQCIHHILLIFVLFSFIFAFHKTHKLHKILPALPKHTHTHTHTLNQTTKQVHHDLLLDNNNSNSNSSISVIVVVHISTEEN